LLTPLPTARLLAKTIFSEKAAYASRAVPDSAANATRAAIAAPNARPRSTVVLDLPPVPVICVFSSVVISEFLSQDVFVVMLLPWSLLGFLSPFPVSRGERSRLGSIGASHSVRRW
jgi:hypothetical protein